MKKNKIILIIFFILALLIGGIYLTINIAMQPPKTVLVNGTNTNPVSYKEHYFFYQLKHKFPETYSHLYDGGEQSHYVIPGLEQTQAIVHSGKDKGQLGISKDMDPQGIAIVEDKYIIISAYSKSKQYNSVLWMLDKKTGQYIKTICLDDIDHVGGITYDREHDQLWVATIDAEKDAQVESIKLSTLEDYDVNKTKSPIVFDYRADLNDVKLTSYLSYHDNVLYVGYFDKHKSGLLASFPLDSKGNLIKTDETKTGVEPTQTWKTYDEIQGISFYKDKILLSQSYGKENSRLYVFDNKLNEPGFDLDKGDSIKSISLPPYLEQVIGQDDHAYLLFESASHKYRKQSDMFHMDRVIKLKVEDDN